MALAIRRLVNRKLAIEASAATTCPTSWPTHLLALTIAAEAMLLIEQLTAPTSRNFLQLYSSAHSRTACCSSPQAACRTLWPVQH